AGHEQAGAGGVGRAVERSKPIEEFLRLPGSRLRRVREAGYSVGRARSEAEWLFARAVTPTRAFPRSPASGSGSAAPGWPRTSADYRASSTPPRASPPARP